MFKVLQDSDTINVSYYKFKSVFLFLIVINLGCVAKFNDLVSASSSGSTAFDCTTPTLGFQYGVGSIVDPYVICSIDQFNLIDSSPVFLNSHYILGRNLDFFGLPFNPIGHFDESAVTPPEVFTGTFNGNNLTIQNINFTTPNNNFAAGVFANASGSVFRDLNLVNISMAGYRRTGLLLGNGENTSFDNINISGSIVRSDPTGNSFRAGGVVGSLNFADSGDYYIRNIVINANVTADDVSGVVFGILTNGGIADTNFTLENITSSGNIINAKNNTLGGVGGIVNLQGDDVDVVIRNVNHNGNVTVVGPNGGSWLGLMFGQFYLMNGANMSLLMEDSSVRGDLNTIADWNQRGVLGSIVGNLSLSNNLNSTFTFRRISAEGDINITPSAVGNNADMAGLFGRITYTGSVNMTFNLLQSYYRGTLSSPNNNNLNGVAGLVSLFSTNAAATGSVVNIEACYVDVNENIPLATISNMRAVIGRYAGPVVSNINDVYFRAPASMLDDGADPYASAGIVELTSAQLLQQSSFTGSLWDFSGVWSIDNGVSPPMLR